MYNAVRVNQADWGKLAEELTYALDMKDRQADLNQTKIKRDFKDHIQIICGELEQEEYQ